MKLPATPEYKPVVIANQYEKVDGRYASQPDAKALTLGVVPGSDRRRKDITAKVMQMTGDTWTDQSGELPLHRLLDLAILFCRSMEHFNEAYIYEHLFDPDKPVLDRIGIQGNAMNVSICTDNETILEDIQSFHQALSDQGEMIGERLRVLARILKELGY